MESKVMEKRKWPAVKLAVLVAVLLAIVQLTDTDAQQKDRESLLALIESDKEDITESTGLEPGEDRSLDGTPVDHKGPVRFKRAFFWGIRCRRVCKQRCCTRQCYCCKWGLKCGVH